MTPLGPCANQSVIFYTKSDMEKETRKYLRQVGLASTVGFSVAFSIVIGAALGYWLSCVFGMWFLMPLFFVMGLVAAYRNYTRFMRKMRKEDDG